MIPDCTNLRYFPLLSKGPSKAYLRWNAFLFFFLSPLYVLTNSSGFVQGCFWKFTVHNSLASIFLPFYRNDLCSLFSTSLQYTGCSNQRWNLNISHMVDLVINNINSADFLSIWIGKRTSSGILLTGTVKPKCGVSDTSVHIPWQNVFVMCSHCILEIFWLNFARA